MKISGYTCIRNGIELDYCFELTIKSLMPVCDEVVVGVRDSTDGTLNILKTLIVGSWGEKVRLVEQPWIPPHGDANWWVNWINEIRQHLRFQTQLMLDADEVLSDDPACHDRIKYLAERGMASWFRRLNFVKDAWHLIPSGHCVGGVVARLGPRYLWMPSDEPHPEGEPEIRKYAQPPSPEMNIFHYGFIRRTDALYKKTKSNNLMWFGKSDDRLIEYEKTMSEKWYEAGSWHQGIVPYQGQHPKLAHTWLIERGRM